MQSGVISDIPIFDSILSKIAKKRTGLARDLGKKFLDKQIDKFNKDYITNEGCSGLMLTNNETKDIMKVIKSLENQVFIKRNYRKITSQEGEFLKFLRPLTTAGLRLMKNVLIPLAKNVLLLLGLTAAASATDEAIQKRLFEFGTTSLIISKEEMEDMVKIVKFFEEPDLLIKEVSKTIKNETKQQKGEFLAMLLGTLAPSLLGSALSGKGVTSAGEGTIRADQDF